VASSFSPSPTVLFCGPLLFSLSLSLPPPHPTPPSLEPSSSVAPSFRLPLPCFFPPDRYQPWGNAGPRKAYYQGY
jgi:hypothetical protein